MTDTCDMKNCTRPVFHVNNNPKLKSPLHTCEAHYYAGQLIGASLHGEKDKYQELVDKMAEANRKYEAKG